MSKKHYFCLPLSIFYSVVLIVLTAFFLSSFILSIAYFYINSIAGFGVCIVLIIGVDVLFIVLDGFSYWQADDSHIYTHKLLAKKKTISINEIILIKKCEKMIFSLYQGPDYASSYMFVTKDLKIKIPASNESLN